MKKEKYIYWLVCVLLATLAKDNGLAWSIVPPLVAFAFGKLIKESFQRYYYRSKLGFILWFYQTDDTIYLCKNGSYEEDIVSLNSRIKGIISWVSYTWIATDYICIVHKPSRNLWIALFTFILSSIFMLTLWCNKKFGIKNNMAINNNYVCCGFSTPVN